MQNNITRARVGRHQRESKVYIKIKRVRKQESQRKSDGKYKSRAERGRAKDTHTICDIYTIYYYNYKQL